MDRHLAKVARVDGDLVVSELLGFAYQHDLTVRVPYDEAYFNKCRGYEGEAIADAINRGRIDLVARHAGGKSQVLDVGIGSGEFIRLRGNTWGIDVNPAARTWLEERGLLVAVDEMPTFRAVTFWDVLEHVPDPSEYLDRIPVGGRLFTSVPIFEDITLVRQSKHYRPGEHLYYWTLEGFVNWLGSYGFELLEHATFETDAGRDSIHSFAFQRLSR